MEDNPLCRSNCSKLACLHLERTDETPKMDLVQHAPQLDDRQQRAGCGLYDTCCCRRYTASCSPGSLAVLAKPMRVTVGTAFSG